MININENILLKKKNDFKKKNKFIFLSYSKDFI